MDMSLTMENSSYGLPVSEIFTTCIAPYKDVIGALLRNWAGFNQAANSVFTVEERHDPW